MVEDAVSSKILGLRVIGGANALGRFPQVVRCALKRNVRPQQKPLGTRTAKRHSNTPSVHDSHPAHLPVELHVGMAADDQGYAQSRENRQSRLSGVKRVKHSFSFRGVAWQ